MKFKIRKGPEYSASSHSFSIEELEQRLRAGEIDGTFQVREEDQLVWRRLSEIASVVVAPSTMEAKSYDSTGPGLAMDSRFISGLLQRYKDAYSEAHAVVAVGGGIKAIGVILGLGILIVGFFFGLSDDFLFLAFIGGIVAGIVVAVPIYVLGILVAAQGQTQLATLDSAVNSSRHLSDEAVEELLTKKWSL